MVDDDQEEGEVVGEKVRCASTWNGNKCSRKKSASFVLKCKWSFGGNPRVTHCPDRPAIHCIGKC